jgi:hypothetical protein
MESYAAAVSHSFSTSATDRMRLPEQVSQWCLGRYTKCPVVRTSEISTPPTADAAAGGGENAWDFALK